MIPTLLLTRERPRVMLQYAFNGWELKPESADRVDLIPTAIPREEGADFWSCRVKVRGVGGLGARLRLSCKVKLQG